MTDMTDSFSISQATASRGLVVASTCMLPIIVLAAWLANTNPVVASSLSAAFIALGWVSQRLDAQNARYGSSIAIVGQAIAVTSALAGHPWQVDMHMTFFAGLAALVLLVDVKAIIVATGLIVLHHLSISLAVPALIYPSFDIWENVARTMLHGAIVAAESAALIFAVLVRTRMQAQAVKRELDLTSARQLAADMLAKAEAARELAESERVKADVLTKSAKEAQERIAMESERAEAAHQAARVLEAQESERRATTLREQNAVVNALKAALASLSDGDLTVEIETSFPHDYETLRSDFNAAVERLRAAIGHVAEMSTQIQSEASAIGVAADSLAKRTERQAATLEETSAAMTELTSKVKNSAHLAKEAEVSTATARDEAVKGGEVVEKAIEAMRRIEESSQKIDRINSVIDEVAFQTNLLALNAGVEAARAGDAGRGFAVVASEVRALAQRCADAAKEITSVVMDASKQVAEGVGLVGQTGTVLSAITESVAVAAKRVSVIADSATAQSHSLMEISSAVQDLDTVTQHNANMFVETSSACQSLDTATDQMKEMVARFKVSKSSGASLDVRISNAA
jgi:methyl-accepting chemotaxis protein